MSDRAYSAVGRRVIVILLGVCALLLFLQAGTYLSALRFTTRGLP